MNVTRIGFSFAPSDSPRLWIHRLACRVLGLAPVTLAAELETHVRLQAVQADGTSAWTGTLPFTLRGVLLNDPEEFLDSTPHFVPWNDGAGADQMGGQWADFHSGGRPRGPRRHRLLEGPELRQPAVDSRLREKLHR